MADKKRPSVAEILAAARNKSGAAAEVPESPAPAAETPAVESSASEAVAPAASAPPAAKPAAKPGERPNVKDILAAARAGKGGAAAPAPPAVEKPAAKPAAEKPAAKPVGEKPQPAAKPASAAAPRDTASILAAARGAAKPGPITKAEAAAKAKPDVELTKGKPTAAPPMPPKPAAAIPKKSAKPAASEDRRGFFQVMLGSFLALGFTSLSLTSALWGLGTARFMFPNILTEPPSKFKVGFPPDFAPGQVETKFVAQFGVWVVNSEYQGQSQIVALRTVCTHLGCTPNWLEAEQKYKCPCHGSGFYKDGINFEGPAPRPLERYAISLGDDGNLLVDKSKLFFEEMGQWSDPQSFYPG